MIKKLVTNINYNLSKNKNVLKCFNSIKNYDSNDWMINKKYFINNNYTDYSKHVLFRNNIFELILIKWDKGCATTIHKHPHNGCLMKVLEGNIIEERYFDEEKYELNNLKKDDIGFMHNILGDHKIYALEESYSLHLYSPPNYYN